VDCDTTLILPDEPAALAEAVTEFVETHNRMQHWKFEIIPAAAPAAAPRGENAQDQV
jgi:hypothetical protein